MYLYHPTRSLNQSCRRAAAATYCRTDKGFGQLAAPTLDLRYLSLLPQSVLAGGKNVPLTPGEMDPGFYEGPDAYRIAPALQECLKGVMVMNNRRYRHIKVALVDLTKDLARPEYAASFDHRQPVFAASVPKVVAMLAAFQLRHDTQAAIQRQKPATLDELFVHLRRDWAATQIDPAGKSVPFAKGIFLRGRLVLLHGQRVPLGGPRVPNLARVFAPISSGDAVSAEFASTGQNLDELRRIVKGFNGVYVKRAAEELAAARSSRDRARIAAATTALVTARRERPKFKEELARLGFYERVGIMAGGDVPASNLATSTVIRDVGYPYIASTLLQSGLYDTNRNGGLWLGADYWGTAWRGALGGGPAQSATAGSLAAFLTLLAQRRLVSPTASAQMAEMMRKLPSLAVPGTGSWFAIGLSRLQPPGSVKLLLSKVGLAGGGADDCAYIEREADAGAGRRLKLRYVAVGLRARDGSELEALIQELDRCILINNGLTPAAP